MTEKTVQVLCGWLASGLPGDWIDETIHTFRARGDERIVFTIKFIDPANEGASTLDELVAETRSRLEGFDSAEVLEQSTSPIKGWSSSFLHMRVTGGPDTLRARVLLLQRGPGDVAEITLLGPDEFAAPMDTAWSRFVQGLTLRPLERDR
ncbi:MAG: hypothetical protein AAFX85_17550 [Pseudomonadota bacterium]